jgi:hypothetical protein
MNDKLNDVKNNVLDKADALCSKLPLDKINQKLGGKLDVNSKKVRLLFGTGILAVIVVIVVVLIALFSSPSLTSEQLRRAEEMAENMGITGVVNVKYAGSADSAYGDVQLYHAEGFDKAQGKVEKITIAVLGGSVVEIKTGHTDPDKFK